MPKINVYLPDDLAARVRESGIPVSRICQTALSEALDELDVALVGDVGTLPADAHTELPLNNHVSVMLRHAYRLAVARGDIRVGTGDLLGGLLEERESLILRALDQAGFSRDRLLEALGRHPEPTPATRSDGAAAPDTGPATPDHGTATLDPGARRVLGSAVEEARRRGSEVVNGSHVIVALIADDGPAGTALRELGVPTVVNSVSLGILSEGLAYGRATSAPRATAREQLLALADIGGRVDRIERMLRDHLGPAAG